MQKDLSVARGDKKRKNGQKSRAGVLHPLFFILLLLLTIRSKKMRFVLCFTRKPQIFKKQKQSTRIPFLGDGPPSARKGTIFVKQVYAIRYGRGFLVLIFLLGF